VSVLILVDDVSNLHGTVYAKSLASCNLDLVQAGK